MPVHAELCGSMHSGAARCLADVSRGPSDERFRSSSGSYGLGLAGLGKLSMYSSRKTHRRRHSADVTVVFDAAGL